MSDDDKTVIDDQPADADKGEGAQGDDLTEAGNKPKVEPPANPETDDEAVKKGEEKLGEIVGN